MEKILPKGITGFWRIGISPPPQIEKKEIERIVSEFKKLNLYRRITLLEPKVDSNYYVISLFSDVEKHHIGINSCYPYYCGIKKIDFPFNEFYDLPKHIIQVINKYFEYLYVDFLNEKIKKEYLVLLDKSEIQQIEYWETETIGNIIFNNYD